MAQSIQQTNTRLTTSWFILILWFALICLVMGCAEDEPSDNKADPTTDEVIEEADPSDASDTEQTREPFCPEPPAPPMAEDGVVVTATEDGSFLCEPAGSQLVPAIIYHHGGRGQAIGGDREGTCIALANAGYLGFSPYRPGEMNMPEHLQSSRDALASLRDHARADTSRIGVMGFSRGGLLALFNAIEQPEDMHAAVLLAPAPGAGSVSLDAALSDVSTVSLPIALFVSENDTNQADHVSLNGDVYTALSGAGKEVESTVYGAYCDDGHELFFVVQEPYWSDVLDFFGRSL